MEHAPLGSRVFLRALRWLGRLRRLGRQLQAVEHAAPRLSLGRGLRIPCAAALPDLAWAWISAHLAHGASPRAKKPHPLALGRIRQSDLARQTPPNGEPIRLRRPLPVPAITPPQN